MKAIIREGGEVKVADVAKPEPKENEVLVKVAMTGFCRTDAYAAQGIIPVEEGRILGHEFSGIVERCGSEVTRCKVGDRVAVMPILKDEYGKYHGDMMGLQINGAYAEFAVAPEEMIYVVPDSMPFKIAAYAEPVAASLAVVNAPIDKTAHGVVVGDNRIAKLTHYLMEVYGFSNLDNLSVEALYELPDNSYDFAVETFAGSEYIQEIMRVLKSGGVCVLKSRSKQPVALNVGMIVEKEIRLTGQFYADFDTVIELLQDQNLNVDAYLGDVLTLEEGVKVLAGELNAYEDKKIFFSANADLCAE